jgi:hypothetical protein
MFASSLMPTADTAIALPTHRLCFILVRRKRWHVLDQIYFRVLGKQVASISQIRNWQDSVPGSQEPPTYDDSSGRAQCPDR